MFSIYIANHNRKLIRISDVQPLPL